MIRGWLAGAIAACIACAGCGDDASCDLSAAMPPDHGTCGAELSFTGELVDWDNDTTFCGVFDATIQIQGGGAMDKTAPNGRFDGLCVSDKDVTLFDVLPSAADSQCAIPKSPYPMPGILVVDPAVIRAGGFFSVRAFTAARRTAFFQAAGLTFDPGKAQVFVHVDGAPRPVSLASAHDAPQAVADKAWAAGDTGHEVFFPNVDPSGGSTKVSVDGCAAGTGSIPVAAGKVTYLAIFAR